MTLSDTARHILSAAVTHPLGLAAPPPALPAAARNAVGRSLLKQGLAAECAVPDDQMGLGWRLPDGAWTAMRITEAGRQAVAAEEESTSIPASASSAALIAPAADTVGESGVAAEAADDASTGQYKESARPRLRDAARALLAAWDANEGRARQAGRQGQLHHLPHRRGRLMRPASSGAARPAVGHYRVSTAEQGHSGLGLEA
jgi:hypothetical protein